MPSFFLRMRSSLVPRTSVALGLFVLVFGFACLDYSKAPTCTFDTDCVQWGGGRCIAAKCTPNLDASTEVALEPPADLAEKIPDPSPETTSERLVEKAPEPRPEFQPEPRPEPRPEITPEGSCLACPPVVETIAGVPPFRDGAAAKAFFRDPEGLAFDSQGRLVIADSSNHLLRRLDLATGHVETIAGSGVTPFDSTALAVSQTVAALRAELDRPAFVAFGLPDQLFFSDRGNFRIRLLSFSPTPEVSTVAGSGTQGDAGGSVPALQATFFDLRGVVSVGDVLYFADSANHVIRKLDRSTATPNVELVAGGPQTKGFQDGRGVQARFNRPYGLAYAPPDTLFIADYGNAVIRMLQISTSTVSTFSGLPNCRPSTDPDKCRKEGSLSEAKYYTPAGLAYDAAGTAPSTPPQGFLYVSDADGHSLFKLALGPVKPGETAVTLLGGTFGSGYTDGPKKDSRWNRPLGLALSSAPNASKALYVADTSNHRIRKIDLTDSQVEGQSSTIAGGGPSCALVDGSLADARLDEPADVAFFNGFLYTVDFQASRIRRINLQTQRAEIFAGKGFGFEEGTIPRLQASFVTPAGIAVDSPGNLWIADTGNHAIRRIRPSGEVETLAGKGFSSAGYVNGDGKTALFRSPSSLVFGEKPGQSALYIADTANHVIRVLRETPGGVSVNTFAGSLPGPTPPPSGFQDSPDSTQARFSSPRGLAFDAFKNKLYVADSANHRVRQIDLATREVKTLAGRGTPDSDDGPALSAAFNAPVGLALHGDRLYISSVGDSRIRLLNLATSQVSTLAGKLQGYRGGTLEEAAFLEPQGMTFDDRNDLLVADRRNCVIRRIRHLNNFAAP